MTVDLRSLAPGLVMDPAGFWVARSVSSVSYPEGGHALCFSLEDESFWFRHRSAVILEVMRLFAPNGPVVDIGGGNGFVARGLEEAGLECILVEPGRTGASNALKRGVKTVVHSTLEGAGFQSGSICSAGLFDVIEHIQDAPAFLGDLHRLLQPGGRVYLTVPAFQNLWSADDVHAGHYRRYSRRTLAAELKGSGFEVEFTSYFFWCLVAPLFAFRTVPTFLKIGTGHSEERNAKEHATHRGFLQRVVAAALTGERRRIGRKQPVPFGTSCIAVARRP